MTEKLVTVLPLQCVEDHWYAIKALLDPAVEHVNGELDANDLYRLVQERKALLVAMVDAGQITWVAACECISYPRKTVLNVIALGGRHLHVALREFWAEISEIAHALGATAIRGAVRPAMQRYYRRYAPEAQVAYAVMEKAL